jgi:hypothetical protein
MSVKPRTAIQNAGTQLYVSEIRFELYAVWREIRMMQNGHISAWQKSETGHPADCKYCGEYDSKVDGIRRAIKHFGGNPRRSGW